MPSTEPDQGPHIGFEPTCAHRTHQLMQTLRTIQFDTIRSGILIGLNSVILLLVAGN